MLLFTDSVLAGITKRKWDLINSRSLTCVFQKIVKKEITVEVVDAIECLKPLLSKIRWDDFITIIDLTGFWGKFLKEKFPNMPPIVDNFHLSRLRRVDSPRLDGVGFMISLIPEEIQTIKERNDLSRPLIFDDVGWSGRTIKQSASILGLSPEKTTVAFLCGNNGNFGEKPAGVGDLRNSGFTVFAGKEVFSPSDDGFHLADFFHPNLKEVFSLFLQIQELREKDDEKKLKSKLKENISFLFPQHFSLSKLEDLRNERRLILPGGLPQDCWFSINPTAFLYPSFSGRVLSGKLFLVQEGLVEELNKLWKLIEDGKEGMVKGEGMRGCSRVEML